MIQSRPVADTLLVRGTGGADTITVGLNGADTNVIDVTINGTLEQFYKTNIHAITIRAGGGNDVVTIDETHGLLPVGATILGQGGADRLTGSSLSDTLVGGEGIDYLIGKVGNDTLQAGGGKDYLWGNEGNDYLSGGAGEDALFGGDGDDNLFGDGGPDSINGGAGTNVTNGGGGSNHVDDVHTQGIAAPARAVQGNAAVVKAEPGTLITDPFAYDVETLRDNYFFGDLADPNFTNRGQGQAIAVVIAYHNPTARQDLITFSNEMGLPAPTDSSFQTYFATGVQPPTDPEVIFEGDEVIGMNGWALEANLDVQWAHAIAPAATIYLVEAASNLNSDLIAAVDYASRLLSGTQGGGVVNMSFGSASEAFTGPFEAVFRNPRYKNVSYVAASGDTGGELSYPGTSPRVLSVGGTDLRFLPDGTRLPENAWNGSGGGASTVFGTPVYQAGLTVYGSPIGDFRVAPDVAYNAGIGISVYNRFLSFDFDEDGTIDSGWSSIGGTSAGAPQWSGLLALANQQRLARGLNFLGSTVNDKIYSLARGSYSSFFNDIVSDGPEPGGFPADVGFDPATGWGSPRASTLIDALGVADTVRTGSRDFEWNSLYREAVSKYPGGNVGPLFTDYRGVGTAVIGTNTVNLTFTVIDKFGNLTFGGSTVTGLTRGANGRFFGADQSIVTIQGPITASSFILYIDGQITVDGKGRLSVKGTIKGLNPDSGLEPIRGLEEEVFGEFES